jgi:hypothetical protein
LSEELPPKEPALFALGLLVQAWFLVQKPKKRTAYIEALRRLIALYRSGNGLSWRPDMDSKQAGEMGRPVLNWLDHLCDKLEQLASQA